jgi:hypothetical protein
MNAAGPRDAMKRRETRLVTRREEDKWRLIGAAAVLGAGADAGVDDVKRE